MVLVDLPRFRYHLARAGKTQRQLARALRIEESALSAALRGRRPLTAELARAIAAQLGVTLKAIALAEGRP